MEALLLSRQPAPCFSLQAAAFSQSLGLFKGPHCALLKSFTSQKPSCRLVSSLSKSASSTGVVEGPEMIPKAEDLGLINSEVPIKVATFRVEEQDVGTSGQDPIKKLERLGTNPDEKKESADAPLDWYSTHMEKLFSMGPGAEKKPGRRKKKGAKLEQADFDSDREKLDGPELAAASLESLNTWKLGPAKKKVNGAEKEEAVSPAKKKINGTGREGAILAIVASDTSTESGAYLEEAWEKLAWEHRDKEVGVSQQNSAAIDVEKESTGRATEASSGLLIEQSKESTNHGSSDSTKGGETRKAGLLMKAVKVRRRRTKKTPEKVAKAERQVQPIEVLQEGLEAVEDTESEERLSSAKAECSEEKHSWTEDVPKDRASIASEAAPQATAETKDLPEGPLKRILQKKSVESVETEDLHKHSPLRQNLKRCERCQEEKDLADYTRTVTTVDGYNPFCRACHAVINAERRGKTLPQENFEGRVCIDCKRFRKAIEFALMKNLPDGLKVRCRACDSLKQAAYRDRVSQKHEPVAFQQCAQCRQTKPISGFSKHRGLKSGYDTYCKLCQRQRYLAWKAQRRRLPMPLVKEKLCAHCEIIKPASEYALSMTNFDGLQTLCRDCVAIGRHRLSSARQDGQQQEKLS